MRWGGRTAIGRELTGKGVSWGNSEEWERELSADRRPRFPSVTENHPFGEWSQHAFQRDIFRSSPPRFRWCEGKSRAGRAARVTRAFDLDAPLDERLIERPQGFQIDLIPIAPRFRIDPLFRFQVARQAAELGVGE